MSVWMNNVEQRPPAHPYMAIFELVRPFNRRMIPWKCRDGRLSLTVHELSCWQTDRQTITQTDNTENNTALAPQVVMKMCTVYSVSRTPLRFSQLFWHFFRFPKRLGFFIPNFTRQLYVPKLGLHFLFNYLQIWPSYTILTRPSSAQNVYHRLKRTLGCRT